MAAAEHDRGHNDAAAPLVSLVTVALNRAATIERTIESVLRQTYAPLEYIVIDGGSSDGTVDVLRRYGGRIAHWRSEPDRGISDAFNKGLALAKGAAIGLINADDWLAPEQIANGVAALERSGADFVFGDLLYHDAAGRALFRIRGDPHYARTIDRGMPDVNHPTLLAWREVYARVGGFDPAYRFAMDYDWLLRVHRAGFRGVYEPRLVGRMTLEGASDRRYRQALAEVRRIAIRHGQPALAGWAWFGYRLGKGMARRGLERLAPATLHERLRRRVNRHFTPGA
jgi:glycosyltransferase involved in cell wall biosynthesis